MVNSRSQRRAAQLTLLDMLSKTCLRCKVEKAIEQFSRDSTRKDGRYPYCKSCLAAHVRQQYEIKMATPEGRRQLRRTQRAQRIASYGITVDEYNRLLAEQNGLCGICGRPETAKPTGKYKENDRPLVVDHDHGTGRVRGLLCHACNVILGLAHDDPGRLKAAVRYLRS